MLRRDFFRRVLAGAVAVATAPLVSLIPETKRFIPLCRGYVPEYNPKNGLIVSFCRNPKEFKINKYVQYVVHAKDGTPLGVKHDLEVEMKV